MVERCTLRSARPARSGPLRCALVATALAVLGGAAEAKPPRWQIDLNAGSEYDTNIHRVEILDGNEEQIEAAPLARLGGRYRLSWRPGGRDRFTLDAFGGTKFFASEAGQSENVAIVSGDLRYDRYLPGRKVLVGVTGRYYDAIAYDPFDTGRGPRGRNFRLASGDVLLTVPGPEDHRLSASIGLRDFVYKPDADFDFTGEAYGLHYDTTVWQGDPDEDLSAAAVDIRAAYRVERRRYDGLAFANACADGAEAEPRCFVPTSDERVDLHHGFGAEVLYTSERIYSARYDISVNDSNSYGQSWVRQRLEAAITSELFWDIFLTARGAVRLNLFLDPLLLARDVQSQSFVSIEDENRNSLSVHLTRDVGDEWAVEGRYTIYSNEFATEELRFRRQTGYVGLVWSTSGR